SAMTAPSAPCTRACRGCYVSFFGGGGGMSSVNATQNGTALFALTAGGPLAVIADGSTSSHGNWIGGLNVGHEWSGMWLGGEGTGWGLLPAAEFEAYYMATTLHGDLTNPTPRLPEHDFADNFPINSGVFLANAVVSLHTPIARLSPYVGGGVGSAFVSIHDAD